jgi:hypothetical protein
VTAEAVKILKVVEKCLKGKGGEEGDVRFAFDEQLLGGVSLFFSSSLALLVSLPATLRFVDWSLGQGAVFEMPASVGLV